jgi:hypothetical protein
MPSPAPMTPRQTKHNPDDIILEIKTSQLTPIKQDIDTFRQLIR